MRRLLFAVLVLTAAASPTLAQTRPQVSTPLQRVRPITSPSLSPYLNLLRGGNPAANYYLGVVPEQQRRSNEAMFGRTFNQVIPRVEGLEERPSLEEELARIGTLPVAAGFGRVPPPTKFSRTVPGFGTPLPMPPPVRPEPAEKPPGKTNGKEPMKPLPPP